MSRFFKIIAVVLFSSIFFGCTDVADSERASEPQNEKGQYIHIEPTELPDNMIQRMGKEWMLVTAGNSDSCNTMTAAWGGIGYLWEKPVAFVFVRESRYTYQFLQQEPGFTLSFFDPSYKDMLMLCGTTSGRDTNKIEAAGLTPLTTDGGCITFEEANMTIECKKILAQKIEDHTAVEPYLSSILERFYQKESTPHYCFIGEITDILKKRGE